MTNTERTLIVKQAMSLGEAARYGGYMIPGVGSVLSGQDAYRAFRNGRILAGLGHGLLSAVSLIPGGGIAGNLGRLGAKVPKLVGALTAGGNAVRSTLPTVTKAVGGAQKAFAATRPGSILAKNQGIATAGGAGMAVGGEMRASAQAAAAQSKKQNFGRMAEAFYPRANNFVNPILAKPKGMTSSNWNQP